MCDLQLRISILLCQNSVSGVLRLYGKPIESRFHPYACEGQWVNITFLNLCFYRDAGELGLAIHVRPPTSDDHNFFVRTSFLVFLDSMEIPLSHDSNHMLVKDNGRT